VCRYFLVGPTAQQTRSYDWLRDHLPTDGSVQLSDVTSMYTALDVIGPKAKELLSELTDTPLSKQDFMHMTCKVWRINRDLWLWYLVFWYSCKTSSMLGLFCNLHGTKHFCPGFRNTRFLKKAQPTGFWGFIRFCDFRFVIWMISWEAIGWFSS